MTQKPTDRINAGAQQSPINPIAVPGPYEQYVRSLVLDWPHLRIIEDFMSVDLEHTPTPLQNRLFKTDVQIIDITTEPKSYKFVDLEELRYFLKQPRSKDIKARLLLVEDLSAGIIETLGSTFDLDPECFALHLNGWWRHYQGQWKPYSAKAGYVAHPLPSAITKQEFQHFQFRRAYHWSGEREIEATRRDHSNLWRPYIPKGIGMELFVEEGLTAITIGTEYLWTGIYLFDPVLHLPPPLLYRGIRNFRQRPKFSSKIAASQVFERPLPEESDKPPQGTGWSEPTGSHIQTQLYTSLRDETVHHILNPPQGQQPNTWSLSTHTPLELPLRTIISSWALVADILNRRMYRLEDQVAGDTWGGISSQSSFLLQFLKLRKHAIRFRSSIEQTIFILSQTRLKDCPYSDELQGDASHLVSLLKQMATRGDSNAPTFLAKNSVEEAQKTFAQAETMKKLSMLAFIFVPISTIATILGIQDSAPWTKYWVLGGLGVPVLILTVSLLGEFRELRFAGLKWGLKTLTLRHNTKHTAELE